MSLAGSRVQSGPGSGERERTGPWRTPRVGKFPGGQRSPWRRMAMGGLPGVGSGVQSGPEEIRQVGGTAPRGGASSPSSSESWPPKSWRLSS